MKIISYGKVRQSIRLILNILSETESTMVSHALADRRLLGVPPSLKSITKCLLCRVYFPTASCFRNVVVA